MWARWRGEGTEPTPGRVVSVGARQRRRGLIYGARQHGSRLAVRGDSDWASSTTRPVRPDAAATAGRRTQQAAATSRQRLNAAGPGDMRRCRDAASTERGVGVTEWGVEGTECGECVRGGRDRRAAFQFIPHSRPRPPSLLLNLSLRGSLPVLAPSSRLCVRHATRPGPPSNRAASKRARLAIAHRHRARDRGDGSHARSRACDCLHPRRVACVPRRTSAGALCACAFDPRLHLVVAVCVLVAVRVPNLLRSYGYRCESTQTRSGSTNSRAPTPAHRAPTPAHERAPDEPYLNAHRTSVRTRQRCAPDVNAQPDRQPPVPRLRQRAILPRQCDSPAPVPVRACHSPALVPGPTPRHCALPRRPRHRRRPATRGMHGPPAEP